MIKTRNFTTTFPISMLTKLDLVSKELNIPKNDILIEAFTKWQKQEVQRQIAEGYKDAKNDPEWMELAEEGMDDWCNQILEWEKD